ncbi:Uncharacterised protein [uncultured archaeon]|nr:Uncharacterised protein [uncultured archaeon]
MTMVCEECKRSLESNPVRFISKVKQDLKTGTRTVSDMEVAVCPKHFSKLKGKLQTEPPMINDKDTFVVAEQIGEIGGFCDTIQLSGGFKPTGKFSFAPTAVVRMVLPRVYIKFDEEATAYIDWEDFLKKCRGEYTGPDEEGAIGFSKEHGVPYASFANKILKMEKGQGLEKLVPAAFAREHCVLPLFRDENFLAVAMVKPDDMVLKDTLMMLTNGMEIQPFVACRSQILRAIGEFYIADSTIR